MKLQVLMRKHAKNQPRFCLLSSQLPWSNKHFSHSNPIHSTSNMAIEKKISMGQQEEGKHLLTRFPTYHPSPNCYL